MTVVPPETPKVYDAVARIAEAADRQAMALEKIADALASDRRTVALETVAEALTEGNLSGVVNLLEQIDVTVNNGLVAIQRELAE